MILPIITLVCDHPQHLAEGMKPYGAELGFRRGQDMLLRKKACEDGWMWVRLPGAPWQIKDYCPEHPWQDQTNAPDNTLEVRG